MSEQDHDLDQDLRVTPEERLKQLGITEQLMAQVTKSQEKDSRGINGLVEDLVRSNAETEAKLRAVEAKLKAAEEALQEHCNACYRDALEPCLEECNVGIALDAIRRKGERV